MKKSNTKTRSVVTAPVAAAVEPKPAAVPAAAPKTSQVLYMHETKFGGFSFHGAAKVPADAKRIDVADAYPVYVLEWGVGPFKVKIAFDVGRDA